MMKFQDIASGALVTCAVVVSGVAVVRTAGETASEADSSARLVEDWRDLLEHGRVLGQRHGARVVLVEFSDFTCRYCRVAHERLRPHRASGDGSGIAVVYRHFPLGGRSTAFEAAVAAECAGAQAKFAEYHDRLFEHQESIGVTPWSEIARQAGVPRLDEFERCLQSEAARSRVERDARAGRSIGVSGTPSFVVDGQLLVGAPAQRQVEIWLRGDEGAP